MRLAVVIPAYNAAKTIESVFARIPDNILGRITDFIVVDDGSTDNTREALERLRDRYQIKILTHKQNLGYGAAQKTGFRQALEDEADVVVLLHADGQYAPEKIGELIKPIEEGRADVVGGSRHLGLDALRCGMPVHKLLGAFLLTKLQNLILRMNLTSYHSGFRAYSRKALKDIDFDSYSDYFEFDSEILMGAKVNNLRIAEVPIPTYYGKEISYLNSVKYGLRVLRSLLKYLGGRYRQSHTTND